LQVDYLDLLLCHRPDIDMPIEETVSAMNVLVRQGKVLYWGKSQWTGQQITGAIVAARSNHLIAPAIEQPEYNVFAREKMENDFLPVFDLAGIGTTIWTSLASGLLTGKYNDGIPDDSRFNLTGYEWLKREFESAEGIAKLAKVKKLGKLAKDAGLPLNHMALLWCLSNPHVLTVILVASRLSQLQGNLLASLKPSAPWFARQPLNECCLNKCRCHIKVPRISAR
jgi:aryl-alcohol dehydrogenase-like predicted oxidoreductase